MCGHCGVRACARCSVGILARALVAMVNGDSIVRVWRLWYVDLRAFEPRLHLMVITGSPINLVEFYGERPSWRGDVESGVQGCSEEPIRGAAWRSFFFHYRAANESWHEVIDWEALCWENSRWGLSVDGPGIWVGRSRRSGRDVCAMAILDCETPSHVRHSLLSLNGRGGN